MTYKIHSLSVSKLTGFDHAQKGGCERRSWFDFPQGLKGEDEEQQTEGTILHAHAAHWRATGQEPQGRVKLGTAARRVIASGFLARVPGMLIERRISGQPKLDARGKWVWLDPKLTPLWAGGYPLDGFIDASWLDPDGTAVVEDLKFTADVAEYALKPEELIQTIQMPGYGVVALSLYPKAERVRLMHSYFSRDGKQAPRQPSVTVSAAEIRQRWAEIDPIAKRLGEVWQATKQDDVPANTKSCSVWHGCAHQSRCNAYKQKGKVVLTAEEAALFETAAPPVHTATTSGPPAGAAVTDGPGWASVECPVCGMLMGKRPPGHSIDPSLCPNVKSHEAATTSAASAARVAVPSPTEAPAAVIPPDAPPNDATLAPPEKKTRAKKAPAAPATAEVATTAPPKTAPDNALFGLLPHLRGAGVRRVVWADEGEGVKEIEFFPPSGA